MSEMYDDNIATSVITRIIYFIYFIAKYLFFDLIYYTFLI